MGIPAIDRQSFSKTKQLTSLPDLLSLQVYSWDDFLQEDILPEKRENKGLEAVFKNIFPVEDNHKNYLLEYKSYYLENLLIKSQAIWAVSTVP